MKKLTLGVFNSKNNDYCYGWSKFESVNDLYTCIGWLCNNSSTTIEITYLEYYNHTFDTFENYLTRIRNSNNIICKLKFDYTNYVIKLEEN